MSFLQSARPFSNVLSSLAFFALIFVSTSQSGDIASPDNSTVETLKNEGFGIECIADNLRNDNYLLFVKISTDDEIAEDINVYVEEYDGTSLMFSSRLDSFATKESVEQNRLFDYVSVEVTVSRDAISRFSLRFSNHRGSNQRVYTLPLSELLKFAEQGAAANP